MCEYYNDRGVHFGGVVEAVVWNYTDRVFVFPGRCGVVSGNDRVFTVVRRGTVLSLRLRRTPTHAPPPCYTGAFTVCYGLV